MTTINQHPAVQNQHTLRTQTMVAFVAGVVLTLLMSAVVFNAWTADAATGETGDTYVAIDPTRVYDGRDSSFAESGRLGPDESKVISIKDGYDLDGVLVASNAVPAGATSITYNLTVAGITGPNFVAITPGDASSFSSSAINFSGASIANAANVKIDADRQIKLWGGDGTGSMFVLIDVTGYYVPADGLTTSPTTTPITTTTTPTTFDGSNITLTDTTYEIETRGDIPGQATDSGTSTTFNRVRFSVSNGDVTGIPGDDGNPSNGKTSNVDPGSTFDSNTIKVTIASGFNDPSNPTSIESRWDFKVMAYSDGVLTGEFARTDGQVDTGTFQMCASSCSTDLPGPQANIIPALDGPSPCAVATTGSTTYRVQFTGTTPGVAPPSNPTNNRFDIRFATASSGAITGSNYNDNNNYTLPEGNVVCGERTVTVMRNNGSPVTTSNVDGTWTLYNIVADGTGFSGDYTSDVSTGAGVPDVGTFTMTVDQ